MKIPHQLRYFCLSLVGATMSKFAKCQTQANCQECHADLSHFVIKRVKRSNLTKEFCRLNPYVPNRKLKPPQMRRFEFSGRDCFINGILHPLQIPDTHEISGNSSQKPPFPATKTPFPIKLTGNNLIKTRNNPTTSRKHNDKILQNQCTLLELPTKEPYVYA